MRVLRSQLTEDTVIWGEDEMVLVCYVFRTVSAGDLRAQPKWTQFVFGPAYKGVDRRRTLDVKPPTTARAH